MDFVFFMKGLIIGFSIAAPVGPIGVLCIRRTLARGSMYGLISGLGAASADAVYGLIAGFGLTAISAFLIRQQVWFKLVGGLFLVYLGIRFFIAAPAERVTDVRGDGYIRAYLSTFALTLTNPMTILSFGAVFAGLGLGDTGGSYRLAGFLLCGVFMGSCLWWLILSGSIGFLFKRVNANMLIWVNRLSGIIITVFGVAALISAIDASGYLRALIP